MRTVRIALPLAVVLVASAASWGAGATVASTTTRVSVSDSGAESDGASASASISFDGRYVAFSSTAIGLVSNDLSPYSDIFVRDTVSGTTTLVSVSRSGTGGNFGSRLPSISAGGRYVAFQSSASDLVEGDTALFTDIFVRDLDAGTTTLVSVAASGASANQASHDAVISGDGKFVAFRSFASNLVPGDDCCLSDVFLRDLTAGTTIRLSAAGAQEDPGAFGRPSISHDGRYVLFSSAGFDTLIFDRSDGTTSLVPICCVGVLSGDGSTIAFGKQRPEDPSQVLVYERASGLTTLVSVSSDGIEADSDSGDPTISHDGRYVAFSSDGRNLVPGDTNNRADVFVRDRVTLTTRRVSVASTGAQGNGDSGDPSIAGNGCCVAFSSVATNLVTGDANGVRDVFVNARGSCTDGGTPPSTTAQLTGTKIDSFWYSTPVSVMLSASDDCEVAATRYSLDQGPLKSYVGPFSVSSGSHALTYFSVDGAGNQEASRTISFGVDLPPVTAATVAGTAGDNGWFWGPVSVTLAATDDLSDVASTNWRLDASPWTTYAGAITVTGTGLHRLEYYSVDGRGTPEVAKVAQISIDAVDPSVSMTRPVRNRIYLADLEIVSEHAPDPLVVGILTIKGTATDSGSGIARVMFFIDGTLVCTDTAAPFECRWNSLGWNGSRSITVRARDKAGREATTAGFTVSVV